MLFFKSDPNMCSMRAVYIKSVIVKITFTRVWLIFIQQMFQNIFNTTAAQNAPLSGVIYSTEQLQTCCLPVSSVNKSAVLVHLTYNAVNIKDCALK